MRIYIDEAGGFVSLANGQPLYSLVLALVVPSSIEAKLFASFSALLSTWHRQETELKGRKLSETQAADLINLLAEYDIMVQFFAVDMTVHSEKGVSERKSLQARAVTENLTVEHNRQSQLPLESPL
jgi:hypothetical protein